MKIDTVEGLEYYIPTNYIKLLSNMDFGVTEVYLLNDDTVGKIPSLGFYSTYGNEFKNHFKDRKSVV